MTTMTIKPLKSMPYANAKVYDDGNGNIRLVSYITTVAEIKDGWLYVYGLYSMTTRKHLGAFAKEYCHLNYQCLKQLYEDNMRFNLITGEIEEIKN